MIPYQLGFDLGWSILLLVSRWPARSVSRIGLEWGGVAVQDEGHTVWGAAPIVDESGMVHLFVARWPERNVDPAWRKSSEIAHYVADQPERPFTFMDVAVTGTGIDGAWDRYAPHNPEIQKFGDTYALLYIANSDYHQPPHPLNQAIGMRVSKSLDGPWRKVVEPGIYMGTRWNGHLGVLDFKLTERSTIMQQEYNRLIEAEVAEICSRYGDLFELWFDGGAHGPTPAG